jgi:predicted acyl esterase
LAEVDQVRTSHVVRMRDGVPIALDAYLPRGVPYPLATILRQTRYCRSLAPRRPFQRLIHLSDHYQRLRRAFIAAGFAWVDIDVRGSGASGGTQRYAWNPDEVRDGAEIVDWIVRQPWSSGKVGALGISYDGTAAEMLLVNRHPAVRAVAPLFSLFDAYADVGLPGGLHLSWFTESWREFNGLLDRNATAAAVGKVAWLIARACRGAPPIGGAEEVLARLGGLDERSFVRLFVPLFSLLQKGVRPVDGVALEEVIAEHAYNYDVHESALKITFRDDRDVLPIEPSATIDSSSPHAFAAEIAASGAAIYSYSGWRDGAYQNSAIKRHLALRTPGSRLTIGPWIHSGRLSIHPFAIARQAKFDHAAELVGFFAHHLRNGCVDGDGEPVHYYTMGEERWKVAEVWPPRADNLALYLAPGRALTESAPEADDGRDRYRVDPAAGSGLRTRWRTLLAPVPADYPDRAERDRKLLVYDSAPLPRAIEVTGHPVVTLHLSWLDATDGQLFVYLEDVAPDGRVCHVTEGLLRALHRRATPGLVPQRSFRRADAAPLVPGEVVELAFELLPVSYLYAAGHRVRLALSGADADHFGTPPPSTIEVHRTQTRPSRIDLPVIR